MTSTTTQLIAGAAIGLAATPIVVLLAERATHKARRISRLTSPLALVVVLVLGTAASTVAAARWGLPALACLPLLLLAWPAALVDLREGRLPDRLVLPFTAAAIVLSGGPALIKGDISPAVRAAATAAVLGIAYLILGLARVSSIGLGDIKFIPGLGAYLGAAGFPVTLAGLLAWPVCIAISVLLVRLVDRSEHNGEVPFGPALLGGTVLALLAF